MSVDAVRRDLVRSAEWHRVRDFAQQVRASPAALAIQGEAGAGKSTLWRAGIEAASAAGYRLLRSEPSASETDLSFAGLSDLLAGISPLTEAGIPGPQLEALQVALQLRPAGDKPPTAHAVGLAVLAALRGCLSRHPLLIAIDDVQWLDDATREVVTFALRRLSSGPLSLLVAARTEAVADPLTAGAPPPPRAWHELLAAVPVVEAIDLAPLDMWQIQNLLPRDVTAAHARMVARQSRGNPFWALQVSASMGTAPSEVPPLARTLTDSLSRSLSDSGSAALAAVAAAGRITLPEVLAVLDDLTDPGAAVDEAVLAGVVVETGARLSVAHPLIGAAALKSLPPGRRTQLYQRLARASSNPEWYAQFAALAASPGPDPRVASALDAAATAAHARAASTAAAEFAAQSVLFTPESDEAGLTRRRIRAAELLFLAGDLRRSLEHLRPLDIDQLATADLQRALPLLLDMTDLVRGTAGGAAKISRAVEDAGTDPRRRALVLALASDVIYGIRGGRRDAALEAIRCAEKAGAPAAASLHRALVNLFMAKVATAEGFDGALLDRAAGLETSLPEGRVYDRADMHRSWSRYTGDLDNARAALRRSVSLAKDNGDDFALAIFLSYLATTEVLAGDYPAAEAAVKASDAASVGYDWLPSSWFVEPRCELLIAAGDLDGADRLADERLPADATATITVRFMGACLRGKVSAWRGDHAATVRYLEDAARCAEQLDWVDPGVRCYLDPWLAETYVVTGRPGDARRISATLRDTGGRLGRPALTGCADRIEALAAAEAGDLDVAVRWAGAAVAAHEASPLRPELARSLLVLGQVERRRKARRQSRDAFRRAYELATAMGHQPLIARVEQEMPRVAAERSGNELTATEQRVADLIAAGATNREAATALFVSVRTVETHVASIYRKLGVRTRAELARRLPRPQ
jgi:DNA-binding CsgD family transcriptional regulator/tetratricopeptide (TPR) repeat protein